MDNPNPGAQPDTDLVCPECGVEVVYVSGDFSVGYRCFHKDGCSHKEAWYADFQMLRSAVRFRWLVELLSKRAERIQETL